MGEHKSPYLLTYLLTYFFGITLTVNVGVIILQQLTTWKSWHWTCWAWKSL